MMIFVPRYCYEVVIKGVVEYCCFYKGKSLLTKSPFDNLNDLRWCHFVLPAYSGPENLKKSRRKKIVKLNCTINFTELFVWDNFLFL